MNIANRIKLLRKSLKLNQVDFAKELGLKQGSVSKIEKSKNNPSEQLILSICRAFSISYEWLKEGNGEMHDTSPRLTPKGFAVLDEIIKRIESPDRTIALSDLAYILGLDADNVPHDIKRPPGFYKAISYLIEIFMEGDQRKIDAVMAQLRALDPQAKKYLMENDCNTEKKAM